MLFVELERAHTPEEIGREEECAICGKRFALESVLADTHADGTIMGYACPACLQALGRYLPAKFPTIEEFEAAKRRYPQPRYASHQEALAAASSAADRYHETVGAARIGRAAVSPPTGS